MIRLLSDHDVELQTRLIWTVFTDDEWKEFGVLDFLSLRGAGLDRKSSDRVVWLYCQAHEMLLITGNRNQRGSDSLGIVIEELNSLIHLPVLTIATPDMVSEKTYRENCAYRIADIALALDRIRGAGRLYIP
jgi:hypothetical protein